MKKYVDAIWCSKFSRLPLLDFFPEVCHVCFLYYYCKALGNVSTIILSSKTIFHISVFMVQYNIGVSHRKKVVLFFEHNLIDITVSEKNVVNLCRKVGK